MVLGINGSAGGVVTGAVAVAAGLIAAGWICKLCPNCCSVCTKMQSHCHNCRCRIKCPNCANDCGKQASCANCGVALHGGWGE